MGRERAIFGFMNNRIENFGFCIFHPIEACMVWAKRTDLALRLQDDFTTGMNLFQAAIYFGLLNDPWPNSAHDSNGDLHPQMGKIASPQE